MSKVDYTILPESRLYSHTILPESRLYFQRVDSQPSSKWSSTDKIGGWENSRLYYIVYMDIWILGCRDIVTTKAGTGSTPAFIRALRPLQKGPVKTKSRFNGTAKAEIGSPPASRGLLRPLQSVPLKPIAVSTGQLKRELARPQTPKQLSGPFKRSR